MGKEIPRSFERLRSGEHLLIPTFANVAAATAAGVTAAKFPRRMIHLRRGAEEIEVARKAAARGPAEIRPVLRELFENHATPARLASLAGLLGRKVDLAASQ